MSVRGERFRGPGQFRGRNNNFRRGNPNFGNINDPPEKVVGIFLYRTRNSLTLLWGLFLVRATKKNMAPLINRPVFLENKQKIGIIDDILGKVEDYVLLI